MSGTQTKNPQQNHSSPEEDVNTADKNTNHHDAWHMERGVANAVTLKPF